MSVSGLLLFCTVYALAATSPGPGVTALVARVMARGLRGTPAFIAGFVVGDLCWFLAAAFGLVALAQSFHAVFLVAKWVGAAYLIYLAYKLWQAPAETADIREVPAAERPSRLFLAGLLLTLGNPKVMVFFLALLPTVVDLATLDSAGVLTIAAAICVILSGVLGSYALVAGRARRLLNSPRAVRVVNRTAGAALAGAAVAVVAKS